MAVFECAYQSDVPIDGEDSLVGRLLEQFRGNYLLHREHDAVLAAQADDGAVGHRRRQRPTRPPQEMKQTCGTNKDLWIDIGD